MGGVARKITPCQADHSTRLIFHQKVRISRRSSFILSYTAAALDLLGEMMGSVSVSSDANGFGGLLLK